MLEKKLGEVFQFIVFPTILIDVDFDASDFSFFLLNFRNWEQLEFFNRTFLFAFFPEDVLFELGDEIFLEILDFVEFGVTR